MTELPILHCFLLIGFLLAPLMANAFFLGESQPYFRAHAAALAFTALGFFTGVTYLVLAWPIFCLFGALLYAQIHQRSLLSPTTLVGGIPFVFSLISATWLVAGSFDLELLGYGPAWSFYAALHGAFLGWIFVGCLAHLANREGGRVYKIGCWFTFSLFLCVAFGIDGVPFLKRVGVVGFSLLMPIMIGHYALGLANQKNLPRAFAWISFISIVATLGLALLNEFWLEFPRATAGVPTMVITHGLLNAVVAIPTFFFAILFAPGLPKNPAYTPGKRNG